MGTVIIRKKSFLLYGIIWGHSLQFAVADESLFAIQLMKITFHAENSPILIIMNDVLVQMLFQAFVNGPSSV